MEKECARHCLHVNCHSHSALPNALSCFAESPHPKHVMLNCVAMPPDPIPSVLSLLLQFVSARLLQVDGGPAKFGHCEYPHNSWPKQARTAKMHWALHHTWVGSKRALWCRVLFASAFLWWPLVDFGLVTTCHLDQVFQRSHVWFVRLSWESWALVLLKEAAELRALIVPRIVLIGKRVPRKYCLPCTGWPALLDPTPCLLLTGQKCSTRGCRRRCLRASRGGEASRPKA